MKDIDYLIDKILDDSIYTSVRKESEVNQTLIYQRVYIFANSIKELKDNIREVFDGKRFGQSLVKYLNESHVARYYADDDKAYVMCVPYSVVKKYADNMRMERFLESSVNKIIEILMDASKNIQEFSSLKKLKADDIDINADEKSYIIYFDEPIEGQITINYDIDSERFKALYLIDDFDDNEMDSDELDSLSKKFELYSKLLKNINDKLENMNFE